MDLPIPGTRFNLGGSFGTVRYVGSVGNFIGIWLGVEWDDPDRGKHDGVKDGERYFTCQIKNSGSFIRPSPDISYGVSFIHALTSKYIEVPHGSDLPEKVVLGSSQGAIHVEAVRLDKIRARLANLEHLREASLDDENVSRCDVSGTIRSTCPSIRGLDLSKNLLSSWEEVALIARELPRLERLVLNQNRLQPAADSRVLRDAFSSLIDLQLNGTLATWNEAELIFPFMPNLRSVELGYNGLQQLSLNADNPLSPVSAIEVINLDTNELTGWIHIHSSLKFYPSLQRVILTSNLIGVIPLPECDALSSTHGVKRLSLSFNCLNSWSDVDALSLWYPELESLSLNGNPLVANQEYHYRPFTIARIPSLLILDGTKISSKERNDSELFYLSHIANDNSVTEDNLSQLHPRSKDLCKKHGEFKSFLKVKNSKNNLIGSLIEVILERSSPILLANNNGNNKEISQRQHSTLTMLATISLRNFRKKICKLSNKKSSEVVVLCWLKMQDGNFVELAVESDDKDLACLRFGPLYIMQAEKSNWIPKTDIDPQNNEGPHTKQGSCVFGSTWTSTLTERFSRESPERQGNVTFLKVGPPAITTKQWPTEMYTVRVNDNTIFEKTKMKEINL